MTSYQASTGYRAPTRKKEPGSSGIGYMTLALFLGIAVAVLAVTAVVLVKTADDARDEAAAAGAMEHSAGSSNVSLPLQSFAGKVGENAEELAMAHQATSAVLPPVPAGDLVKVHMTLKGYTPSSATRSPTSIWARRACSRPATRRPGRATEARGTQRSRQTRALRFESIPSRSDANESENFWTPSRSRVSVTSS